MTQIVSASSCRTEPFCVYGRCGGCQLQHISYENQLEQKRLIVEDALRRLGGLRDVEVGSCVASPENTGYRSKVRFHCGGGEIGFHMTRSNTIVPVERCPLLPDGMNAWLKRVAKCLSAQPMRGVSEVQITQDSDSHTILTFIREQAKGERGKAKGREEEENNLLLASFGDRDNREWGSGGAVGVAVRVGSETRHLWGEKYSMVWVEGRVFRVSPGSFFQANTSLLPALVHEVLGAVKSDHVDTAVELYAGVGLFSIALAGRTRRIVAVEWNRDAVEDAIANLEANRITNVEVMAKSVEDALDLLISQGMKPELVVLDPPREGLSNVGCRKLLQLKPQQMIYVSCDPATLARDIKVILATGGYRIEKVTPFDMFPHTAHIECVCSFVRKEKAEHE